MGCYRGSKIAQSIDNEYKKRLEWKEKTERLEELNKEKEEKKEVK